VKENGNNGRGKVSPICANPKAANIKQYAHFMRIMAMKLDCAGLIS
jgi:hypothetical protein